MWEGKLHAQVRYKDIFDPVTNTSQITKSGVLEKLFQSRAEQLLCWHSTWLNYFVCYKKTHLLGLVLLFHHMTHIFGIGQSHVYIGSTVILKIISLHQKYYFVFSVTCHVSTPQCFNTELWKLSFTSKVFICTGKNQHTRKRCSFSPCQPWPVLNVVSPQGSSGVKYNGLKLFFWLLIIRWPLKIIFNCLSSYFEL